MGIMGGNIIVEEINDDKEDSFLCFTTKDDLKVDGEENKDIKTVSDNMILAVNLDTLEVIVEEERESSDKENLENQKISCSKKSKLSFFSRLRSKIANLCVNVPQ